MSKNRALGSSVHTTASCWLLFLSKKNTTTKTNTKAQTTTKTKIKTMTNLEGRGGQGVFAFHAIPTKVFKLCLNAIN